MPRVSRRRLLGTGAGAAAGLLVDSALPTVSFAGLASRVRGRHEAGETPLVDLIVKDPVLHVARRLTYGITPATVKSIHGLGIEGWIDRQLNLSQLPDKVCSSYLKRYPLLGLSPASVDGKLPQGSFDQMAEMQQAALVRATWSSRQIYELMCEFWWNHFNIGIPNSDVWDLCGLHDSIIRKGALGKFSNLLNAVVHSPAMLTALNQFQSVKDNPNQNYAREMMELHTVGVGHYSEADVESASLLLTGLGLSSDGKGFAFDSSNHYVGPVKVMGFSDPNSSASDGLAVIERYVSYLAHHPATAAHLATELARRFVSDEPSSALVSSLSAVYLRSDTAVVPVLKAMFSSSEFMSSTGQKLRRPIEQLAASLRALGYSLSNDGVNDMSDLEFMLEIMGQAPMGWPQPNGYPDVAVNWISASAAQTAWAAHLRLAGGWWTETLAFPGLVALIGNPSAATPSGQVLDMLCQRLLFQTMIPEHRAVLLSFMNRTETQPIGPTLLSNLTMVAKVILDSPYFALR